MNIFLTAAKEIVLKKEEKRLIEIIRDVLAGKNKSEWSMLIRMMPGIIWNFSEMYMEVKFISSIIIFHFL